MVGTGSGLAKVYYDPVKSQRCGELQSPSSSNVFATAQGEILAVRALRSVITLHRGQIE